MSDSESFVVINGHKVPSEYADLFISGRTGKPIPDEQWDEQLRRIRVHQPDFSVPKVGA
jgi:hypothetical protein